MNRQTKHGRHHEDAGKSADFPFASVENMPDPSGIAYHFRSKANDGMMVDFICTPAFLQFVKAKISPDIHAIL
ncbi:hypothetical protein [Victivallis lenta]|uniref:hypothetical protein n=1 Tax=Victivallis lenta TaxID=2606640 RepID=UPI0015A7C904|nr:hypothetical protein [Victivallis lenta]